MRTANVIRRTVNTGTQKLLWPTFQSSVCPLLIYCSRMWTLLVQRKIAKSRRGMHDLLCIRQLQSFGALALHDLSLFTDMITVFKSHYGFTNCSPLTHGLFLSTSNTRSGGGVRLSQRRVVFRINSLQFCCRLSTKWNKLTLDVTNCQYL